MKNFEKQMPGTKQKYCEEVSFELSDRSVAFRQHTKKLELHNVSIIDSASERVKTW